MMEVIRLTADLLNYYGCLHNDCLVDGERETVSPDDVHSSLIHVGIDEMADSFQSPLYELGKKLEDIKPEDISEIIFVGEGRDCEADFSWMNQLYEYHRFPEEYKRLPFSTQARTGHRTIRLDGDFTMIENVDKYLLESCANYLYINNYYEDVDVSGIDKNNDHLFFRAPKENTTPADGKVIELTQAPLYRNGTKLEHFWCRTIHLHVDAVTYVHEIELECYEGKHKGSRIALVGRVPKDLKAEEKRQFVEGIPYVDVWESPEFVVKKLKDAGWMN